MVNAHCLWCAFFPLSLLSLTVCPNSPTVLFIVMLVFLIHVCVPSLLLPSLLFPCPRLTFASI
ncbi:hypothetical protein B0T18DRAFT_406457 [Schizothecium vesticola]|uniref:NADH dehydrogenase subunit 1 n=1 Tax=Schizothecium vesticola TaxID=314040 RepID=A0AA40K7Z7_9PEZI|nr:hypothetical protein B0T18DRAFT_406457 [Schizothecium vesticola]